MKKILIIPSWYPTENDKISGSFFREQAKILLDKYDIKVLYIKFINRPAIKLSPGSIKALFSHILKFLFQRNQEVKLPDDIVFLSPPLSHYVFFTFSFSKGAFYRIVSKIYLKKINNLIISGWRPDLIHAHSVHIAGIIALQAKQKFKIPYVITEHMPFSLPGYHRYIQPVIKESFQKADLVLSVSYDKVRQLCMSGIDVSPNLVYNYVDENKFKLNDEKYKPGEPLKIISIGAASYLKDHLTLLKAMQIIKNKNIPFKLTLIGLKTWGEKDTYDNILEFIEKKGLINEIQIVDKVDRDEISKYLQLNNIFLITSIAEGLPVSVLEAMAAGLIVLSTRHGGTEDILTSETGILVKIKDYTDIADKISDIFNGKFQFEPKIIRDHVVSICGTKAFSQRLSNYYAQAIQNNSLNTKPV